MSFSTSVGDSISPRVSSDVAAFYPMQPVQDLFQNNRMDYHEVTLKIGSKEITFLGYKAIMLRERDCRGASLPQGNTLVVTKNDGGLCVKRWFNVDSSAWCLSIEGRNFKVGRLFQLV